MFRLAYIVVVALLLSSAALLYAQQPESAKLPRFAMAVPLGIPTAGTSKVILRGWLLDGVKEVKTSPEGVTVNILKAEKVGVPNKLEAKHVGDTQLELELILPENASFSSLTLTPSNADGDGPEYALSVGSQFPLVQEKESNKGFSDAQVLSLPQIVAGMIEGSQDVDVFAIEAAAGQTLHATVIAHARGSALDAALMLFDADGRPLAFADDTAESRDPQLTLQLPAAGTYYLSLQDGLELGGSTHPYRLQVELK